MVNWIGRKAGKRGTGDTHTLLKSVGSPTLKVRPCDVLRLEVLGRDVTGLDFLRALVYAFATRSGPSPNHRDERSDHRLEFR